MLNIKTQYFKRNHKMCKVNRAGSELSALKQAVGHMSVGDYEAAYCMVFDDETAELLLVVTYDVKGKMTVQFKRDAASPRVVVNHRDEV